MKLDEEWRGIEGLIKFGLGVYYGVPITFKSEVTGGECVLDDELFDFAKDKLVSLSKYIKFDLT